MIPTPASPAKKTKGGGGPDLNVLLKLIKTKFAFVNGQKCDEAIHKWEGQYLAG